MDYHLQVNSPASGLSIMNPLMVELGAGALASALPAAPDYQITFQLSVFLAASVPALPHRTGGYLTSAAAPAPV